MKKQKNKPHSTNRSIQKLDMEILSVQTFDDEDLSDFSKGKRDQILNAAIELFLKEGYKATSMEAVAKAAGVTKQTIYSHFQDKEGLFTAIIKRVTIDHLEDHIGAVPLSGEPKVVLKKLAQVFMRLQKSEQYLCLMRTVIGESARFPELARLYFKTVVQRGILLLSAYFESRSDLNIKDPVATARIFCGSLIACLFSQELLYGKEIMPFAIDRLVDPLIEQILKC